MQHPFTLSVQKNALLIVEDPDNDCPLENT